MGFFSKTLTFAAASVLAAGLTLGSAQAADKKINIGWTAWSDAEAVTKLAKKVLEDRMGYKVDLQYANDQVPQQQQQIESMLNNGAKALIVASIDGTALTQQLADAGKDGVKVIAYDRLINGTPDVDYYVTFDNQKVGVQQGTSLLTGLGILDADGKDTGTIRLQDGPVTVVAELPKRVDCDQAMLAGLVGRIRTDGADPADYVDIAFSVPERKYTAWPKDIRQEFEPARTVRTGKPKFRLLLGEEAR